MPKGRRTSVIGRGGSAITLGQFRMLTEMLPPNTKIYLYDEGRTDRFINVLAAAVEGEDPFGEPLPAPAVVVEVS